MVPAVSVIKKSVLVKANKNHTATPQNEFLLVHPYFKEKSSYSFMYLDPDMCISEHFPVIVSSSLYCCLVK